jgi:hypothetical protein
LKEKVRDNVAAIRVLRLIEDESREATQDEKAVLARYTGWGALSNVFHPYPRSVWEARRSLSRPWASDISSV